MASVAAVHLLLAMIRLLAATPCVLGSGDTLVPGEMLDDGQTLISATGRFEAGFFSPGDTRNSYFGIWYHNITDMTAVWVANKVAPVTISPGYVYLTTNGTGEICNDGGSCVWFTDTSPHGNNTAVKLLDTGNILLVNLASNNTVLQSFDYPADTLLPGMKLGLDKGTKLERQLISWQSLTNPYPSAYSCAVETQGMLPEVFIRKGSARIFRSGPWNGYRFSGIPIMGNISQLKFSFVSNQQEVYFSFSAINNSVLSRVVLDPMGELRLWEWSTVSSQWNPVWAVPQDQCDTYALCGANGICTGTLSALCQCLQGFVPKVPANWRQNNFSDGCVRENALSCSSDGFLHLQLVKLPDTLSANADSNKTLSECSNWCLKNCSCMAYAFTSWSGCLTWSVDLIDLRTFTRGGDELYVRVAASNLDSARANHVRKTVLVVVVPAVLGFLLLASTCVLLRWRREGNQDQTDQDSKQPQTRQGVDSWAGTHAHDVDQGTGPANIMGVLSLFDLSTIIAATNNFSVDNKLGEGGFGIVYKGELPDGQIIAVKMLSRYSSQGPDEFRNELLLIANLQHRNLVRLLGCCTEGYERILILEYMENRSLDAFIYDKTKSAMLDWRKRLHIIVGIARGLLYLHHDSYLRVVHRDLKPSNILLDKDMNPKISDFGIARIFEGDDIQENATTRPIGTFGYMAPEYLTDGIFSFKSDVFSFGVIMLEILSGRRNRVFNLSDNRLSLLALTYKLWKEDRSLEMLDEALDSSPPSEILDCIRLGLLCVQENSEDRPTMAEVVMMLTSEDPLSTPPKQPATALTHFEEDLPLNLTSGQ